MLLCLLRCGVLWPTTVLVVDWTAVLGFSALRLWLEGCSSWGAGIPALLGARRKTVQIEASKHAF